MAGLQCSSYQRNQRSDDITGCFKGITPILWFPLHALFSVCTMYGTLQLRNPRIAFVSTLHGRYMPWKDPDGSLSWGAHYSWGSDAS
jgi:hypothetical protein